ncbi:cytoplasmic protein [Streptococcus pneumoniae]|nr:cytoplasmic protein [Streptococcus pneumoniae]
MRNQINAAILVEKTDFARIKMTLSNYFYKVKQQELYDILGDVNPEYALKYMTAFLLKFLKKDQLMQKCRDIFVDSLVVLGYIVQNEDGKYELAIDFDKERLTFYLA